MDLTQLILVRTWWRVCCNAGYAAFAAAKDGSPIRWTVDPNGPACPDAEDNALAGVVAAGSPFPTDHVCAPAHSGCTCMLARGE